MQKNITIITINSQARSWLQFADDAAIVASSVKNALQCLLNLFHKPGAVGQGSKYDHDKCISFSMMKKNNQYQQILSSLFIFDKSIPQVPLGGEFKYLGRTFGFDIKFHSMHKYLRRQTEQYAYPLLQN